MKYSIVNELISTKKIRFLDETNTEVFVCKPSPFKFVEIFQKPFFIIDSFAKKTSETMEIINSELSDLRKLGYDIYSLKISKETKWISGQRVMYVISKNRPLYSKKLLNLPPQHKLQKDKTNNRMRLVGEFAGYPHSKAEGGSSPWISIED